MEKMVRTVKMPMKSGKNGVEQTLIGLRKLIGITLREKTARVHLNCGKRFMEK